jgi:tetratricopeptide (TPR) repeat protein
MPKAGLMPDSLTPDSLNRIARTLMQQQDAAGARAAVARLVAQYPAYAPGWLTASQLELGLGQPGRALQAADRGLAAAAGDPALLVQRVRCLHAAGYLAQAEAAATAAAAAVAGQPAHQAELGHALLALGAYEAALPMLMPAAPPQDAAIAPPQDAATARALALVLRFLGRFEEAEHWIERDISLAPQDWEAYPTRSQLRRQTPARNHVAELEALLATPAAGPGEVHVRYALAKEYEDLGEYEKSFTHLRAGAALHRRRQTYAVADDVAAMARIAAAVGPDMLARAKPVCGDGAPIFVFGLPRSGTTLVDRILGCHPDVTSHGEITDFPTAVTMCAGGGGASMQDLIARAAAVAPAQIGAAYLARVRRLALSTPRFIDKLPINYLYAGWIAAALPGATLVHVRRDKMANGYGLFKTLFAQGYPFSYDLDELGQYIVAYEGLMAHWRRLLGPRLIELDYENLVADQRGQTQALLRHCGLSWNPACLAPQANTAPSLTHSAVQVRAPVNTESLSQWRHFEQWLQPLAARVAP